MKKNFAFPQVEKDEIQNLSNTEYRLIIGTLFKTHSDTEHFGHCIEKERSVYLTSDNKHFVPFDFSFRGKTNRAT
jgi:hypothetical protein